jgi:glycosyltransferase 2 family protein
MNKKRLFILLIVAAILGALVYLQVRTWQKFDWHTFARVTKGIDPYHIAVAIFIIYVTYVLRALRWQIFLRPVCNASFRSMIGPQFVGFTGLALLGRPGELIRPYMIAKKENLTFSSQVAVWAVERIFDIGAFAVLMAVDVFAFSGRFALPPDFHVTVFKTSIQFVLLLKVFGGMLLAGVGCLAWVAYKIRANTTGVALWVERKASPVSRKFANSLRHKVHAFGEGLNTIHDRSALIQLVGVSLAIWFLIALAYREILHSYPPEIATRLHAMEIQHVLLLMGASMVGSLLQLPALGGGSQLATIGVMSSTIFSIPREQAVSAGMMLWLVTFVTCIPAGLLFAHFEHVSLRRVTEESNLEEQKEEALEGDGSSR